MTQIYSENEACAVYFCRKSISGEILTQLFWETHLNSESCTFGFEELWFPSEAAIVKDYNFYEASEVKF